MLFSKKKKKDRYPIVLSIALDSRAIKLYLKEKKHLEVINDPENDFVHRRNWTHSYKITIIPSGKESNLYFHHRNNEITQVLAAFDNIDGIEIEFRIKKGELLLFANNSLIIFASIYPGVEIEVLGPKSGSELFLKPGDSLLESVASERILTDEQDGIRVDVKETASTSLGHESVKYENRCAQIIFSSPNDAAFYN